MQRRLTIAIVGVALASVLLVGAGVLILAQIGARAETEAQAIERLDVLAEVIGSDLDRAAGLGNRQPIFDRLSPALGLSNAQLAWIDPRGTVRSVEFTARGRGRTPGQRVGAPFAELSSDQAARLAAGETVVIDTGGGRTVTVIRSLSSIVGPDSEIASAGDGPGGAGLAVFAQQQVTTIGQDARLWFVLSAIAVLAGAVAASLLLARRFTRPIRQIERVTAAVAGGDFSARVDVDEAARDELADLGRSVDGMAADLERSKALDQQFLMSVSHDLRTPLTAIRGYAEALTDGAVDDTRQTGEIIAGHSARLERLVGDLLDLAKLDANRFSLDLEPLDVAVVVGRTVAGLTPRAEQLGLRMSFKDSGPAIADIDADRLGQAVGNLVDNAIKFARSTVDARVTIVHDGGPPVAISISDDGPGIAEVDLPHVFERLYVARSQPARAENPSGMGLAIVRDLATAMGGTIAASRNDAGGTTMTLRLPFATGSDVTIERIPVGR